MDMQNLRAQVEALAALRDRLSNRSFARSQVERLHSAAEALHSMASAQTGEPRSQRAQKVAQVAERYLQSIKRTRDDITTRELGGQASLSEQFAERLGVKADRYANQIVDAFANADGSRRTKMLAQIVDQGDGRSLAALLESPSFVHGVDGEMLAKFRGTMEEKHAPDIAEKRRGFESDVEAARAALEQAERLAQSALEIDDAGQALAALEETRRAEAKFAEATES